MDEKINDLEQLRIHELRDLGRKMGVNAPTSKKKDELIREILKIMNGESVPFSQISKKGRPVRNNADSFDVVDLILPSQTEMLAFTEYTYGEEEKMRFMVNMDHSGYDVSDNNAVSEREGILEIRPEKYAIIHVDGFVTSYEDVFVNMIMVNQLKLRNGDKVRAKCRKIKENYPEIAFEIVKIDKETGCVYEQLPAKPLSEKVVISAPDIKEFYLGGRYFVSPSYDSYKVTEDIALAIKNLDKDYMVETLYLNAMMERLPYESKVSTTAIPFSRTDENVVMGTNLFFDRLKHYAECGKDIIVVVNQISQYSKSYNNIYIKETNYQDVSNKASHRTKTLLSNAKYTDNGSITIIMVDPLKVPTSIENMYRYEILPILNETIK